MHNFVYPFFADFPDISAYIINMPFIDGEDSLPAVANTLYFIRKCTGVFRTEYVPTVVKTDFFQMILIGNAVFFIFRNIYTVKDVIPFSLIKIYNL